MSLLLVRARLVACTACLLPGVAAVSCGGAVEASSVSDGVDEGEGAGGAEDEPSAGGRNGAGGARGGSGGNSSGGSGSGSGGSGSGSGSGGDPATCQITEPGTPMTPEDCLACVGGDTGCTDAIGNAFTSASCARIVPDALIECLWYPNCYPAVSFSVMVACPSPTGCTLCYVNF